LTNSNHQGLAEQQNTISGNWHWGPQYNQRAKTIRLGVAIFKMFYIKELHKEVRLCFFVSMIIDRESGRPRKRNKNAPYSALIPFRISASNLKKVFDFFFGEQVCHSAL
jgi:hypothetical protein